MVRFYQEKWQNSLVRRQFFGTLWASATMLVIALTCGRDKVRRIPPPPGWARKKCGKGENSVNSTMPSIETAKESARVFSNESLVSERIYADYLDA